MANLGQMVVKIVGDVTDLNKSIDVAQNKFNAATSNFQKLGANLTKFVTLPILGIGAAAVKSAADMEMQAAAFETMLGSAEKARVLLEDLTEMAAKTPFQLTDLADATKTMLAFGIANEKVLPNLQMLGDIAGGNSEKLRSLTLAFSQIQSTGRLMGQDLLQLVNAGFNPLQIISEKTGKTMAQLKKDMEAGAISADMVSDAFKTATSEGGRFFGGMERASVTLKGLVSTLLDNFAALGRSIGEVLLPTLKDFVKNTSDLVQRFTNLDEQTKKNIITWGLVAASIGPVILAGLKIVETYNRLQVLFKAFPIAANPALLIFAALAAAALFFASTVRKAKTDQENLNKTLDRTATVEQARAAIKAQQRNIETLEANRIAALTDEQIAKYDKEIAQEKQKLFVLNQRLRDLQTLEEVERQRAEASAKADAEEIARLEEKARLLQESIKKTEEEQKKLSEYVEERTDLLQEQREGFAESANDIIDMENKIHEAVVRGIKKEKDLRKEAITEFLNDSSQVLSMVDNLFSTIFSNRITEIEQESDAKISALQEQLEAAEGNAELEADLTAQLEAAELEKARKIAQAKRKQAIFDKAQAIADAAIQTSLAVIKALPRVAFAAIIAGLGAAQIAAIASTPLPEVPAFADGGIVQPQPGGVQATVAEAGVAEAIIPLDRLDNMLAQGGGTTHLIVNLDSRPLLDKIFDATRNGTVLIDAGAVV